jgi:hypothetical protein
VQQVSILLRYDDRMTSCSIVRHGRRVVAFLTLACGAAAQSAMLACPMALRSATGIAAQHAAHAQHAHGAADVEVSPAGSAVKEGTTSQPDAGCTMPIGCGATGITAPHATTARMGASAADAARPYRALDYRTVFPPHDPPPPRLRV